jgi:molybdopterin biosynthesis enzyme
MMEPAGSVDVGPWAGADRVDAASALHWILDRITSLEPRPVPLADALDLMLAGDVEAVEPSPGFDTAAMDGYAICASGHGCRRSS